MSMLTLFLVSELLSKVQKKKKDLKELLNIESINIEEVRVSNWNIEKF